MRKKTFDDLDEPILPEIPSDWDEQLGEPLSEVDIDDSIPRQSEFGFLKKQDFKVSADLKPRSWAEFRRKMCEMFGSDPSEELE